MTWMTWRQHRAAAAIGAVILAAIAAALVWLGVTARSKVRHYGLTSCLHNGTDCTTAIAHLQRQYHWLPPVAASLFALPLLAGMFWGAPLIAREIETGTYRLVWTQSISRLRWISTKLALVLGATATATVALSLLAVWAFQPLIPVLGNRFRGGWFDVQGIVPAAYMLFALALGSCMGAIWRKTIPAMATTIVGFAAVRIPIHNLRRHLISPRRSRRSPQLRRPWPPDSVPAIGSSAKPPPARRRPDLRPKDPQPASTTTYQPDGSGPSRASKPRSSSSSRPRSSPSASPSSFAAAPTEAHGEVKSLPSLVPHNTRHSHSQLHPRISADLERAITARSASMVHHGVRIAHASIRAPQLICVHPSLSWSGLKERHLMADRADTNHAPPPAETLSL